MAFVSCERQEDDSKNNDNIPESTQSFPNETGNHWKYKYTSSLSLPQQEIDVNITGDTIIAGQNAKIWRYQFSINTNFNFSRYVVSNDTTVVVYRNGGFPPIYLRYLFPIVVGNAWTCAGIGDSAHVRSQETVSVPAGNFETFRVSRKFYFPGAFNFDTMCFRPRVGLIKMIQGEHENHGPVIGNGLWELISYSVK